MLGHLLQANKLPAGHTYIVPWPIGVIHDPIIVKKGEKVLISRRANLNESV